MDVQVISEDFVEDVEKGDVAAVIKAKAISDWGGEVRATKDHPFCSY